MVLAKVIELAALNQIAGYVISVLGGKRIFRKSWFGERCVGRSFNKNIKLLTFSTTSSLKVVSLQVYNLEGGSQSQFSTLDKFNLQFVFSFH